MDTPIFAIVPIEALKDRRLTLEQLRVLVALFSFRGKNTNTVYPRRQAIAERTGMHLANISSATSALERLGWLTKEGKGGHSKATRYTITVPETVAQSATVAEQATVAQSATGTLAQSATRLPVADWARGKELKSEQTKGKDAPALPTILSAIKKKSSKVSFSIWAERAKSAGEKLIDGYQPLWRYAEKVGIPQDFIDIAWIKFRSRYSDDPTYSSKCYIDWRRHFLNSVEGNWLKLWFFKDGAIQLTTVGQQADIETREAA